MFANSPNAADSIPSEFKKVTEALFPVRSSRKPVLKDVENYARNLKVETAYKKLIGSPADMASFFARFKRNFSLLIAKTWVERADEIRKETLQSRLPGFYAKIEKEDYVGAVKDFSVILEELSYLFFGEQSRREDFTEYAFRIDSQIGLFWWYGSRLSRVEKDDKAMLRALLVLGICYLTGL
jgi:hypothetical protein